MAKKLSKFQIALDNAIAEIKANGSEIFDARSVAKVMVRELNHSVMIDVVHWDIVTRVGYAPNAEGIFKF